MRTTSLIIAAVLTFVVITSVGCLGASRNAIDKTVGGKTLRTRAPLISHETPPSLGRFDGFLDVVLALSVLAFIVAVALFFTLPNEHKISCTVGAASAGGLFISLVLKVTLWLIPWIAGALVVGAFLWLSVRLYSQYQAGRLTALPIAATSIPAPPAAPTT
jgi:hypothetical protein